MTVARPRLEALTGLRGLAAWYVVFYHVRLTMTDLLPAPVIALLAKGYLAVDLFFMLSGFVLWLNHGQRLAQADAASAGRFWWRRIARIWPLHATVLAAFCGFVALLALTGRDRAGYPLDELPLHLLLIQNWGFTPRLSWNHPAWSISAELAAYLLFPLLAWLTRRDWSTAAVLGVLAVLLAALHGLFAAAGQTGLGSDIVRLGLPRCLIEFTAGTFAARLWQRWHDHPAAPRLAWLGAAGAMATAATGSRLGLAETAWVPLLLLQVLLGLAFARGRIAAWLSQGPLHWLGEVSYSTYLWHFGLFILFKLLFVDAHLQLDAVRLILFVIALLVVSGLSHAWLELPAQHALNALQPRRRPGEAG